MVLLLSTRSTTPFWILAVAAAASTIFSPLSFSRHGLRVLFLPPPPPFAFAAGARASSVTPGRFVTAGPFGGLGRTITQSTKRALQSTMSSTTVAAATTLDEEPSSSSTPSGPGSGFFATLARPTDGTLLSAWDGLDGAQQAAVGKRCVPPLSHSLHKGSAGRVAVLGGSARYTGAPYYAGRAALCTGADLATVYTAREAAGPIKCYSPDLMVEAVYAAADFDNDSNNNNNGSDDTAAADARDEERTAASIRKMVAAVVDGLDRVHCLVIGPGLGRCPAVMQAVASIIVAARRRNLYLVLDADALFLLAQPAYRTLLRGYDRAVLTPNAVEYQRLYDNADDADDDDDDPFRSVTMVQKGAVDTISVIGTTLTVHCSEPGGLKRAGGIGDVLAGTIGTMVAWQSILHGSSGSNNHDAADATTTATPTVDLPLACWTACCLVKRATKRAFDLKRRAMSATDVLDQLGAALEDMVP